MALFSKNWIQSIVSLGEPYLISFWDRKFGGKKSVALRVADGSGSGGGSAAGGTVEIAPDGLGVVLGNATTGKVTVNGALNLPSTAFIVKTELGNNGAGSLALTGTKVGDKVLNVTNITTPGDVTSSFESTITVAGHIQQSSATDLSAKQLLFVILHVS